MNVLRQPVPWNYHDLVVRYLRPNDSVLDIGTGGGETFSQLARFFGCGLGIDTDAQMIQLAAANSTSGNICFRVGSARLEAESETFDVILDRACALRPGWRPCGPGRLGRPVQRDRAQPGSSRERG
jgi:2-polyprenyl-3-methyl-5-hydroxy-6-metoxy-1,4-benzoquinol methylase